MTDIGKIVGILTFIILIGFFFAYSLSNNRIQQIKALVSDFNVNFISGIPGEVQILIGIFMFVIILIFILSFYK